MSKYGLEKNLRVAALEFGPHQIRVNAVNPTVTMTEMGKVDTHFVFVFIICLYFKIQTLGLSVLTEERSLPDGV